MKKYKVIISTGIGPLHFIKSGIFLSKIVDLEFIQSWVPKNTNSYLIRILSKLVGHKHLASGLKKRTPLELQGRNHSCAKPDFFFWGLNVIGKVLKFPKRKQVAGWAWTLYGRESRKYIKDAQIFHVRSGAGQGGAIKKAKNLGMKVIVDHSIAHPAYMDAHLASEYKKSGQSFDLGMESPLFQFTVKDAEMADCVLVNSHFVKKTFVAQGFSKDKIKIAYLGVRDDFMGIKTSYDRTNKVKLLFTGSFGFRKGAEYLLKALQVLEAEGFLFEMIIVGGNSTALSLLKKYPVTSIQLVGFVPQDHLKIYLKESDIYVFPSLCEGCASSGMEALAAGLPVIATEESGFPIKHEVDGIIIPFKSEMAIVKAIKSLAQDKDKREFIGKNAAQLIKNNHSWDHYALAVKSVYAELLKIK